MRKRERERRTNAHMNALENWPLGVFVLKKANDCSSKCQLEKEGGKEREREMYWIVRLTSILL